MEKAHDVSVDEPSIAHQAILFILDVLIRNGQEMEIENLYNTFGDPSFTPQMLRAIGGNDQALKLFLQRYPSLFTIRNQIVRANSGADQLPCGGYLCNNSAAVCSVFKATFGTRSTANVKLDSNYINDPTQPLQQHHKWDSKTMKEIEQEAIGFFKKQMARKEEEWLPIVSVAGHASQASPDIRKFVGPQNEFLHFLVRYPDIFLVRDEYCGLKGKADKPNVRFPPPSPPPKRRSSDNSIVSRSTSFTKSSISNRSYVTCSSNAQCVTGRASSNTHLQLNPLEVKSVHYIMRLLHRCGKMLVQNVPNLLNRAPEPIVQTIGHTRDELVHFLKLHSAIFQLHPDGCVSVKSDAVRALIHKDKSFTENSVFTSSGIVLRIFPKYGIVNMENNEQVFFDIQSCQFESFGDLTCILHPGDRLWFNAILGPKDGSTKWRSLKTWIKMKHQNSSINKTIGDLTSSSSSSSPPEANKDKILCVDKRNSNFENESNASSSSTSLKHSMVSADDTCGRYSSNSTRHAAMFNRSSLCDTIDGLNNHDNDNNSVADDDDADDDDEDDLNQYQLATYPIESSDDSSVFGHSSQHNNDNIDYNTNDNALKTPLSSFAPITSTAGIVIASKKSLRRKHNDSSANITNGSLLNQLSESVRSTSMMDLRSLTCSLPVLTSTNGRLGFVPINCPTACIHADSVVPTSTMLASTTRSKNDSNHSESNSHPNDKSVLNDHHKQHLNGCIDPDTIRKQVHSTANSNNMNISERMVIDEKLVSVSVQTISSGDILATNIFIE